MRKVKVTNRWLKESYFNIIVIGYCDLQYLLNYQNAIYYTCGIYGWNSDIYFIDDNTVICTGYRPTGNIRPDYNLIREYNNKAEKIVSWENKASYEEKKIQLQSLLDEFISKVKESKGR